MKHLTMVSMVIILSFPLSAPTDTSGSTVEVMLASTLDEDRGYCLDIAGGKGEKAPVENGLQAHTCYNYTGEILVDQGFDESLTSDGQFKITYFDVCMSADSIEPGSALSLSDCDQSEAQAFTLNADGQLVPEADPELCVTVSSTEKKEGRGATPVHVMRPVSLESCDETKKPYQTWSLNKL